MEGVGRFLKAQIVNKTHKSQKVPETNKNYKGLPKVYTSRNNYFSEEALSDWLRCLQVMQTIPEVQFGGLAPPPGAGYLVISPPLSKLTLL